ncbi:MAG: ATPase [Deltaproteobacteria bacterium RIFCSPLOWO2_12_FULL_40_28]|nr:MAG: ATPase [Deltaproteobacteria bacterium RIFCSPHIGHO2_02_FULL_40_28]OGQ19737.1 MAG: ATPase [Deltaproteobacteria bacterium RIFCSPHIGHO2_12_FULL_40_32]OGQ41014.1 MAG: ATPase [Deltaproteobacteria bacterium RIFCSPLOWO2_02_FULL_40_36]OGQ54130.1 MAG: ATPase [Deltaproteobacteria bacterium RIFCSPLOWO2_12_FULL_40_28]
MHFRKRHILGILSKRAKIFPVIGIVGPRQVGKTTFLMQEWKSKTNAQYITLDKSETIKRAKREPENFLLSESEDLKRKLIIDEAQKVPLIFDSIKSIIDERRRIGLFTLSGSVEFSDKSGVRESLAGRMGVCHLYPMTLSELTQKSLHIPWVKGWGEYTPHLIARDIDNWLNRGGIPIFCSLHDETEVQLAVQSWLEALCYRDLQQLKGAQLNGDVAMSILSTIAHNPTLNLSRIADDLGVNRNMVSKYLAAFEALFLLYKLPSFQNRRAAPDYVFFDCAILSHFLGNRKDGFARTQTLKTLLINEILAQYEYGGESRPSLFSYYSRGGAEIDLVLQDKKKMLGIQLSITSDISPYALRGLKSFLNAQKSARGIVLAPVTQKTKIDGIDILPWTHIG